MMLYPAILTRQVVARNVSKSCGLSSKSDLPSRVWDGGTCYHASIDCYTRLLSWQHSDAIASQYSQL